MSTTGRDVATLWPSSSPRSVVVVLRRDASIAADTERWRDAVRRAMRGSVRTVTCEVSRLGPADARTLDGLAKVALDVHRSGGRVQLRAATRCLDGFVGLAGLADVLPRREGAAVADRAP